MSDKAGSYEDASRSAGSVGVLGGGPAGLTAAYELQRIGAAAKLTVFEGSDLVGGISRTESHRGFRFDIGGHRFFTKVPQVTAMWEEVLGEEFITVERLSRIYYRGRYYNYPLSFTNALGNLGVYESLRIMGSYAKWRLFPRREEHSFEDWVINRFGGRLYAHFFESYTRKVWGISPREIRADWAAQRIKDLSLYGAVRQALTGRGNAVSLIERFRYPRLGPGMMWEMTKDRLEENGAEVAMRHRVERVAWDGDRVTAIDTRGPDGAVRTDEPDHVISTLAIRDLIEIMDPAPPAEIVEAAQKLRYRDFLIVTLVLDHADPFPDNWIYVHDPNVRVGRIQNFRAWSKDMVPEENRASIGMEYFCNEDEEIWTMDDADLRDLAARELERLGLAPASSVVDHA
ncbi:MAG: FAD-dependent oxidoreductase, partial [Pseudomonadota bacterium]